MGTPATLGHTTKRIGSKVHRDVFFDAYPELEGKVVVHHAVPQVVLKKYPGLITPEQMHSLENLRGIPMGVNNDYFHQGMIRNHWNEFIKQHPGPNGATVADLLRKATEIDDLYGRFFNPPIR